MSSYAVRVVSLTAANGGQVPVQPAGPAARENENWTLCGTQIMSNPNGFFAGLMDNHTVNLKPSSTQIVSDANGFHAGSIDN